MTMWEMITRKEPTVRTDSEIDAMAIVFAIANGRWQDSLTIAVGQLWSYRHVRLG